MTPSNRWWNEWEINAQTVAYNMALQRNGQMSNREKNRKTLVEEHGEAFTRTVSQDQCVKWHQFLLLVNTISQEWEAQLLFNVVMLSGWVQKGSMLLRKRYWNALGFFFCLVFFLFFFDYANKAWGW